MKYIIMCGGNYKHWEKPRHLAVIKKETLIERTIRLLKENNVEDIAISSNNPVFEQFGVPVLKHDNLYNCKWHDIEEGEWYNCFYPTNEEVCYIFGDVVFSPQAIKTIVETETNDIEFFASKEPFDKRYIKDHFEPFALKVVNQEHLHKAIEKVKKLEKEGKFWRKPIMWELWAVIKDKPVQPKGQYDVDYVVINDYTCDIDWEEDIKKMKGVIDMVRLETIREFTLEKYDELKNIQRKSIETKGKLYVGDTFECSQDIADYLLGANDKKAVVVKVIEIIPEDKVEEKPKKAKKKNTK